MNNGTACCLSSTARLTKLSAEQFPAFPGIISVEENYPLSHEWENGLWGAFRTAGDSQFASFVNSAVRQYTY